MQPRTTQSLERLTKLKSVLSGILLVSGLLTLASMFMGPNIPKVVVQVSFYTFIFGFIIRIILINQIKVASRPSGMDQQNPYNASPAVPQKTIVDKTVNGIGIIFAVMFGLGFLIVTLLAIGYAFAP